MKSSMKPAGLFLGALLAAGLSMCASPAAAHGLGVEVWTDRGSDAVYQPGDVLQVRARASEDSYLLVYEIDSEGYVHVLHPARGQNGFVSGHTTYHVPADQSDQQLVVNDPTGEDFIVAIASREPFEDLPWYLRPYDVQGGEVGYVNRPAEAEEGVTTEGKIVGDPFVAMERIRRRVCAHAADPSTFGTAYTSYYVHEKVRYPRYLCNDCHRPGYWAWWDGFDPYYAHCSAIDFRINWSWGWGPAYWCGYVPYYVYVCSPTCPPGWGWSGTGWYSSWSGWNRWCRTWGGPLVRYKSPPPPGYVPPARYRDWRGGNAPPPPGFVVAGVPRGAGSLPIGHNRPGSGDRESREAVTPGGGPAARMPVTRDPVTRLPVVRDPSAREPADGASDARGGVRVDRGYGESRRPEVGRMPWRPVREVVSEASRHEAPAPAHYEHRAEPVHYEHRAEPRSERPHETAPPREAPQQHNSGSRPAPALAHDDRSPRGGP
ncbi:MAG: DUF4384 domain-containing protein [Candidatus Eisenbacteria bacterium]|nr:DUF4384 domain-containing protein [Candidatus Eisenbacteria bacterium]